MSIYKRQHRDDRKFWRWVAGLLFGSTCTSYLAEYQGQRRECNKRAGHKGKHGESHRPAVGLW